MGSANVPIVPVIKLAERGWKRDQAMRQACSPSTQRMFGSLRSAATGEGLQQQLCLLNVSSLRRAGMSRGLECAGAASKSSIRTAFSVPRLRLLPSAIELLSASFYGHDNENSNSIKAVITPGKSIGPGLAQGDCRTRRDGLATVP